jgi:hypothetical protein
MTEHAQLQAFTFRATAHVTFVGEPDPLIIGSRNGPKDEKGLADLTNARSERLSADIAEALAPVVAPQFVPLVELTATTGSLVISGTVLLAGIIFRDAIQKVVSDSFAEAIEYAVRKALGNWIKSYARLLGPIEVSAKPLNPQPAAPSQQIGNLGLEVRYLLALIGVNVLLLVVIVISLVILISRVR